MQYRISTVRSYKKKYIKNIDRPSRSAANAWFLSDDLNLNCSVASVCCALHKMAVARFAVWGALWTLVVWSHGVH
eukprot:SAG11_NODE_18401_length_492_cov_0.829517_1_plen_74_part_01